MMWQLNFDKGFPSTQMKKAQTQIRVQYNTIKLLDCFVRFIVHNTCRFSIKLYLPSVTLWESPSHHKDQPNCQQTDHISFSSLLSVKRNAAFPKPFDITSAIKHLFSKGL